jgi:antitoxin PrlF
MRGDGGVDKIAALASETGERALLVGAGRLRRQVCAVLFDRSLSQEEGHFSGRERPLFHRQARIRGTGAPAPPCYVIPVLLKVLPETEMAVTVTRKGQVTIPEPVRDRLGISPGSKVDFEFAEDGRAFLRRAGKTEVKPSRFERMRGTATGGLTTDEIMALTRGDS